MKVYIDANIYLDLFLNRKSTYRDFAQEANTIFHRAKGCEFEIILSDVVTAEVARHARFEILDELRLFLGKKVLPVCTVDGDRILAASVDAPGSDALHIAVAIRLGADCIVTRNIKHFVSSPIPVFLPESF